MQKELTVFAGFVQERHPCLCSALNKSRTTHVFGRSLVRRMALYDWVSTPSIFGALSLRLYSGLTILVLIQLSRALTASCPAAGIERRTLLSAEESETSHFSTATLVEAR